MKVVASSKKEAKGRKFSGTQKGPMINNETTSKGVKLKEQRLTDKRL